MLRLACFTYFFLAPVFLWSQHSTWVEGSVFLDKNQNQIIDRGERGLKSIAISNGRDIVYTDNKGFFTIEVPAGHSVFPIIPNGYALAKKDSEKINNALFYYPKNLSGTLRHNFGLITDKQPSSFKIGAVGDIQVGNDTELNYAGKSIFRELAARDDIAFHMMLGDLVNDDPQLFSPMKAMLSSLPAPSWTVLGNHDRTFADSSFVDAGFNNAFGASTYAFNYGGVHFIVLNNVFSTGKRSYEGRVSDEQLQFLANDLKHIPASTQVVLCQHIPMRHTRNRTEVLSLLEAYSDVLILSGHTHQVARHFYNQGRVQEIVTGAPSGSWWTGEMNASGIPDALMQCGSPRNYFTVTFNQSRYSLDFKGIGLDQDQQMDLTFVGDTLIANVYGASDSTLVQLQVNEGNWMDMKQAKRPAESVLRLIDHNAAKRFPASGKRITPLRKRNSPHIWQIVTTLSPGTQQIRVKATDRFGYAVEVLENVFISEN